MSRTITIDPVTRLRALTDRAGDLLAHRKDVAIGVGLDANHPKNQPDKGPHRTYDRGKD